MKRSKFIALICVVVAISAVAASLTVADVINPAIHPAIRTEGTPPLEINNVQSITKSNGYYNISVAIPNNSANKTYVYHMVGNLGINQVAQEDIPGLAMYMNGTAITVSAPIRYDLKAGDTAQINMLVPCSLYRSGTTINVVWWGSPEMWGEPIQLP